MKRVPHLSVSWAHQPSFTPRHTGTVSPALARAGTLARMNYSPALYSPISGMNQGTPPLCDSVAAEQPPWMYRPHYTMTDISTPPTSYRSALSSGASPPSADGFLPQQASPVHHAGMAADGGVSRKQGDEEDGEWTYVSTMGSRGRTSSTSMPTPRTPLVPLHEPETVKKAQSRPPEWNEVNFPPLRVLTTKTTEESSSSG